MPTTRPRTLLAAVALVVAALAITGCTGASAMTPGHEQSDVAVTSPTNPAPSNTLAAPVDVAFYGDSYTHGHSASVYAKRWSSVLSTENGWTELNFGISGLGFQANRSMHPDQPTLIVAAHPDMVIVMLGINDARTWDELSPAKVHAAIDDDLKTLRDGLPDAPIVVLAPMWATSTTPKQVGVMAGWLQDAAAEEGAYYVPGATSWIHGNKAYLSSDDLHPNDAGYQHIANELEIALRKLGLVD